MPAYGKAADADDLSRFDAYFNDALALFVSDGLQRTGGRRFTITFTIVEPQERSQKLLPLNPRYQRVRRSGINPT